MGPPLPCLDDDLRFVAAALSCLVFFLSLLLVSDETSGELLADLFPVTEILENNLVRGGLEAVKDCSASDSSEEVSDPEDYWDMAPAPQHRQLSQESLSEL